VFHDVGNREGVLEFENLGVESGVRFEYGGNLLIFENGFPRTLGLADAAVDALFGVDVELIRERLRVGTVVGVNTVDRADFDARLIDTIQTEPRDHPRHFLAPIEFRRENRRAVETAAI
jgi:hypothetical protein